MVHPATAESIRFTGTPALVVEVLPTNRGDDLVLKLSRYAQAGLPHYWILDPANRVLLAYGLDSGKVYDLLTVIDEHEPREISYGLGGALIDVPALLR
jgi:Uma2 family endonuclease